MMEQLESRRLFSTALVYEQDDNLGLGGAESGISASWSVNPWTNKTGAWSTTLQLSGLEDHNELRIAVTRWCESCNQSGPTDYDIITIQAHDGQTPRTNHLMPGLISPHEESGDDNIIDHDDDSVFIDFDFTGFDGDDVTRIHEVEIMTAKAELDIVMMRDAIEGGQTGQFRVVRSGDWNWSAVQFSLSTSTGYLHATNGTDYDAIGGNHTFQGDFTHSEAMYFEVDAVVDAAEAGGYEQAGFKITSDAIVNDPDFYYIVIYDNP
jgi:hypothetical protein